MRFALPAVAAFLAADATSAAPGRLREDEDRKLQSFSSLGEVYTDNGGGKPAPALDAATYNMPELGARSADALPRDQRTVVVTLSDKCLAGDEARCCARTAANHGGTVVNSFEALKMCEITTGPGRASALSSFGGAGEPQVARAEANAPMFALQVPSWGLDRVNQQGMPLDDVAEKVDAAGTRVYILDTGVRGSHDDFAGLMSTSDCHANTSGDSGGLQTDMNGHGTHVASTACGLEYGVAENCEICAVQVLMGSGSGSTAGVVAGIDHVADNCPAGEICVANMSLGGGASTALDDAVNRAAAAGVVMVVAAGNDNSDACGFSPARASSAVTVGSTTSSDGASTFSNFGACVDVYDPGSAIKAAWHTGDSVTNTISGTSMASPHVAGIVAGAVGGGYLTSADHTQVKALLAENWDHPGIDNRATGRDQGLATIFYQSQAPTVSPAPTPAPTACQGRIVTVVIHTDNYPGETSWEFGSYDSGMGYSDPGTTYTHPLCFDMTEHEFVIRDSYGDGMCCSFGDGFYKIEDDAGVVLKEGGSFADEESWTLTAAATSPPVPTSPPVAPPTPPPVAPPTSPPVAPPTSPPVAPPTSPPVAPPTSPPVAPPTAPPVAPPTAPPVAPPTPGNPPALVVAHADTFTFTPVSACRGSGAIGASGTTAGQCAQACAVLEDCLGFEVFRTATEGFDAGDCVLSGSEACDPDDEAVWYYARSISD